MADAADAINKLGWDFDEQMAITEAGGSTSTLSEHNFPSEVWEALNDAWTAGKNVDKEIKKLLEKKEPHMKERNQLQAAHFLDNSRKRTHKQFMSS